MKKSNVKDQCKTIEQLRDAFNGVKSICTEDTWFIAKALLFLAEKSAPQPATKRTPTKWQRFFAEGMKAGKSPAAIAVEWKELKK